MVFLEMAPKIVKAGWVNWPKGNRELSASFHSLSGGICDGIYGISDR